ncbi:MAG: sulfite exporter TauE/SafE family protein [Cyclobacteriaceae bacterium]|nr:sulfite exporter TauE/SafE family protein [Cyclobacteriaceae bacterium]
METEIILLCGALFLVVSFLYSSVGHAGASGYLAIMALLSFPVASMKPISLTLNIVVSLIASYKFIRAGYFDKKLFLVFAFTSIPMAFLGGYLQLDPYWFKKLAGLFLLGSATMLLVRQHLKPAEQLKTISLPLALGIGALIGFLSGLLGVGGGIFLSPIIILLGLAQLRTASGIAALFILCNSLLGLAGHYTHLSTLPREILFFIPVVIIGGYTGAHLGSGKFNTKLITTFLFVVLLSAGIKFILVG